MFFQNRKKRTFIASSLGLLLVFLVFFLLVLLLWQRADHWAHAKLEPYLLQMEIQSNSGGVLHVQYDYGYGFIPEHTQGLRFKASSSVADDNQSANAAVDTATSISHWKQVRQFRLSAPDLNDAQVRNIRFQLGQTNLLATAEVVLADKTVKPFTEIAANEQLLLPLLIRGVEH